MRMINFAKRNFKELIRDPLSLIFEIVLPLFLLFIFQQFNIPAENYRLENFTPSILLLGFSFITLFSATLIAKDRTSSLLIRLGTSPMKSSDYILGYILSLLPIVLIQNVLFFIAAIAMGLEFTISIIPTVLVSMIISIFFISLGILIGSLVNEKGTGGLGSIIVQLVCFTSGMYFPVEAIGGVFEIICKSLPFEACLTIIQGTLHNDFNNLTLIHTIVFLIYFIAVILLSIIVFKKRMISDNK
ncbi:ABC transporter permease [Candidatus Saccharibacteria bacterium]|nr:ABC transporter permease [Candidatus Saccharibacteria bacterium]